MLNVKLFTKLIILNLALLNFSMHPLWSMDEDLKPFYHGVASGDPLTDAVVIWTKVTPESEGTVEVSWRVALDPQMQQIVRSGKISTDAEKDYTAKVDVKGLAAGTTYYYAFSALGANSLVGKTKTVPDGMVDQLRFAVVSCSNYQAGYFHAYRKIGERTDLDAVIHLGDYIYEYSATGPDFYGNESIRDGGRAHMPDKELLTLDDYRMRYAQYRKDPDLMLAHQNHPFITVWDDHESANDAHEDGAENHNEGEGDWETRKAIAKRAYLEYFPVRSTEPVYRTIHYGDLADLIMIDTRLEGRDEQIFDVTNPAVYAPDRTLLGDEQREWLKDQLSNSDAHWKLIGNQVIFSEFNVGWAAAADPSLGTPEEVESIFMDIWDGYPAERNKIIDHIADPSNPIDNVVILTGDFHSAFAYDVAKQPSIFSPGGPNYDPATGMGSVAVEFASQSITSANFDENLAPALAAGLEMQINNPFPAGELAGVNPNPHMKYVDLDRHGYFLLDLTENKAQADFYYVDILSENSDEMFDAGFYTISGQNHLKKAAGPSKQKEQQDPVPPSMPTPTIAMNYIGGFDAGLGEGAAEITAFDPESQRLFVVNNAATSTLQVLDLSDPTNPAEYKSIDVTAYGAAANHVDVKNGIVAVAIEADPSTEPGKVIFFDTEGVFLGEVTVGVLPDMLVFSPDGSKIVVANEGEPNDEYTIDPEGSISVISVPEDISTISNDDVQTADFSDFDAETLRAAGVRIFGPGATAAQDLEPEYVTITPDGMKAYVTCQENNAVAILDIMTATVEAVLPLGFKDHSLPENSMDASNRDGGINLKTWPVLGMYQPDAIASFAVDGKSYLVTANEGDARDYDGFSEEFRVEDFMLDPTAYPNASELQMEENLGRLRTTDQLGFVMDGSDKIFNQIYSYGARSFSIWDAETGELIYDSGNDFEMITAAMAPEIFNNDEGEVDERSDDKGPEPEGVTVGMVNGKIFAFVGLERTGGVMVYDISNPMDPKFALYEKSAMGDVSPEGLIFISADHSPSGNALLVIANEVSGTISVYEVDPTTEPAEPTIVDIAVEDENFSILVEALTTTGLADDLSGEGPFTVFAPTNQAFTNLLADLGFSGLDDPALTEETLTNILLYHVVSGNVLSTDLSDGDMPTTLQGSSVNISIEGDQIMVNDANVGPADITAANGVIHVIDKVLLPPSGFTLQILHASDLEGGVDAIANAPNFAALVDKLEDEFDNTVVLSSGDNYIPGPFFNAAGDRSLREVLREVLENPNAREGVGRVDAAIMNIIGFDASAIGNHEFDAGTSTVEDIIGTDIRDGGEARWLGTQFPYLSANLDFSESNLAGLFTPEILPNTAFTSTLDDLEAAGNAPKIAPATIIERNGQRIGVVGATTQILESITSSGDVTVIGENENDMTALAAILQPTIDDLLDMGINKIILVSHLQQFALEQELIGLLNGVDIVAAGGSDVVMINENPLFPGDTKEEDYPFMTTNADGDPALIVSTNGEYTYVGRLVVDFDGQGIIIPESIDPVSDAYPSTDDFLATVYTDGMDPFAEGSKGAKVQTLVNAVEEVVNTQDGNIFGTTAVYLDGRRSEVRTEETNLGNLTADANLIYAQSVEPEVVASLKNGGGIRAAIGQVIETSPGEYIFAPPQANPAAGKEEGEISQLDISNSLRFNNNLSLLTVTAEKLLELIEHGVAATEPGATPGQFPQVGGMRFGFNPNLPSGERVLFLDLIDSDGNVTENIVMDGSLQVDPEKTYRIVTLGFLAGGGDGYPFPTDEEGANRIDLDAAGESTGAATFAPDGTEQDALAEYLVANFADTPFDESETPIEEDQRIQRIVPPSIVDIALDNPDFESLVAALIKADLVEALSGPGPFTVFAPTDDAFAALLESLGLSGLDDPNLTLETLTSILLYHVVPGKVLSTDLSDGAMPETLQGTSVEISIDGEQIMVNDANVGPADIIASNGVIHVIDKVLVPSRFKLQILHASDLEGGVDAIANAPNFAALVDKLEDEVSNSILLSSGDNYIPGPFFNAAGDRSLREVLREVLENPNAREGVGRVDISIMNILGFDASAVGNHEFDAGTSTIEDIIATDIRDGGEARWLGSQFPYLSANLDFSDSNLAGLFTDEILPNTAFQSTLDDLVAAADAPKIAPATIVERGGQKVGIVGATTQIVESISSTGDVSVIGVTEDDMPALAAILQPTIDQLIAMGINKIVLVTHLQQFALEQELIGLLSGVDVVAAGGSDVVMVNDNPLFPGDTKELDYPFMTTNNDGDPAVIVSTNGEYTYVGRFVAEFDNEGVLIPESIDPEISDAYASTEEVLEIVCADADADPFAEGTKAYKVKQLVDAVEDVVTTQDGNIFGETTVYLDGRRSQVRTEETNLGNLTADANLAYAKIFDPSTMISIKNGGGIRSAIGEVVETVPGEYIFGPPQANPAAGKEEGEISQLDISNSLRFNNALTLLTLTAKQLKEVIEHGVAATEPGATPGQFPQVGGIQFGFNPMLPPGMRVIFLNVIDENGTVLEEVVKQGQIVVDEYKPYRIVTLNFLAGGGDSYPFPMDNAANRVDLDTDQIFTGSSTFAPDGTEQDALAEFLAANYSSEPFSQAETPVEEDQRIQRVDDIIPFVKRLVLVNAETNQDIMELEDGAVIDFLKIGTDQLSIRAETMPEEVGSVEFVLNGESFQVENFLPYAIQGDSDNGTNYNPFTPPVGKHVIEVIPYEEAHKGGNAYISKTINIEVIDGSTACFATSVVSYMPGERKNGSQIPANRTDTDNALGAPQENIGFNFVSLGFGGEIVLELGGGLTDDGTEQPDLVIVETSFGRASKKCFENEETMSGANYPEKARLEVSMDGTTWYSAGSEFCRTSFIDLSTVINDNLPYVKYLKIIDMSDPDRFGGGADGYDVDGIIACPELVAAATQRLLDARVGESVASIYNPDFMNTVPDESPVFDLSVFPNPVEDQLEVIFTSENSGLGKLQIVNTLGSIMLDEEISINQGVNRFNWNMGKFENGVYMIRLENSSITETIRFVKQ